MNHAIVAALCLLVVPVQMQLAGLIAIGGIRPDLPAALVYGVRVIMGPWVGGGVGLVVGLVMDRFSADLVGPHLVAKVVIGVVGGFLAGSLVRSGLFAYAGVASVLFFLQSGWLAGLIWWRFGVGWQALYQTVFVEACYTLVVAIGLLWLLRRHWPVMDKQPHVSLGLNQ